MNNLIHFPGDKRKKVPTDMRHIKENDDPAKLGGMTFAAFDHATDLLGAALAYITFRAKGTKDQGLLLCLLQLVSLCSPEREVQLLKAIAHVYNNPQKKMHALLSELANMMEVKDVHPDAHPHRQVPWSKEAPARHYNVVITDNEDGAA